MQDSAQSGVNRMRLWELGAIFGVVAFVALVQVVLSSSANLSRWKGGGFGMYSEPHPYSSRSLWIKLRHPIGTTYLRLSPLDPRLDSALAGLSKDRRAVWMRKVDEIPTLLMWPRDEALRKAGEAATELISRDSYALGTVSGIDWAKSSVADVSVVETRLDLESKTFENRLLATVRVNREDGAE